MGFLGGNRYLGAKNVAIQYINQCYIHTISTNCSYEVQTEYLKFKQILFQTEQLAFQLLVLQ